MDRLFTAFLLLVFASITSGAFAAAAKPVAPTLTHVFPVAVQVGTTTAVTAIGKFTPWPTKVWTGTPGITFHPAEKSGEFNVEVSPGVPAGAHLIRLYNDTGASAPRFLVVTPDPQSTETEPNDQFARPQTVEQLPVTINARLNKSGDVDSYAVRLAAGQTLIAAVDAYVLGSPMDAVLRVVDTRGLELALNHDNGRNPDPFLSFTARTAGTYVLQIFGFAVPATADVRFTGNDSCVYRLHLSGGPQVRYTLPLGVPRAQPAKLRVFGANLGALSGHEFALNDTAAVADAQTVTWRSAEFENTLDLPIGDGPEFLEDDLRTSSAEPSAMAPPFAVSGCIAQVGEKDRFVFAANKGDTLVLAIQSASLGFPLDAWVAVQNSAGKELARADDGANADPVLEWEAPETASYAAVVGSVLHRAGGDHLYRLSIRSARPNFRGIIAESAFAIEPAGSVKIKVTARRLQGFKSKLTASIVGLPQGVSAEPVEWGEPEKEITLELAAAADASPFSGPIQVRLRGENPDSDIAAVHEMTSTALKNGVPQGFRDLVITSTDQLWLTVLPAAEAKVADDAAK